MKSNRLYVVLAALLVVISCADTSTDPFAAPQFSPSSDSALTPVVLLTPAIENTVSAQIDANGGRLHDPINGHEIKIMAKAVSEPTLFVMKTVAGSNVVVDLTAWRQINGAWVEITTFNDDGVKLRLSYANTAVKQPNRLRVVYLPQGNVKGAMDPLITLIDKTNKQAQAKLSHFSHYSMAID